jgi:hypothetical protein
MPSCFGTGGAYEAQSILIAFARAASRETLFWPVLRACCSRTFT